MSNQEAFEDLVQRLWKRREIVAKISAELSEEQAIVNQLESEVEAMVAATPGHSLYSDTVKCRYTLVTRRDVRIINADEFAAAMIENGMEPPMTEPKLDTRALKDIAKKLPDFPGAEPFESVYLKATADKRD